MFSLVNKCHIVTFSLILIVNDPWDGQICTNTKWASKSLLNHHHLVDSLSFVSYSQMGNVMHHACHFVPPFSQIHFISLLESVE